MTGNSYFLDTNVVIDVFLGKKIVSDKITDTETFFISAIVLGELFTGINRVSDKLKHLEKLHSFLDFCTVLDIDKTTSQLYGEITAALLKKGKPIPTNDVWIAATVRQYDLTLVTGDNHFQEVENLVIESW